VQQAIDINIILDTLRPLCPQPPQIVLVLGSGLGDFADDLEKARRISTRDIPGYPISTVEGHTGAIVAGEIAGKRLVCFQGRVHFYEGYPPEAVLFPVNLAAALGAKVLILTNAAGGIHRHLHPGSLMLIEDHINLQFRNRQRHPGESLQTVGTPYSERLLELAQRAALQARIPLHCGVLGALTGPSYETPAEVRMWVRLGADAACMSTAPEATEGARLGLEVMGISCITNRAAGLSGNKLDHAEVIATANRVKVQFQRLLREIIIAL
jgi:purine-nucleoside phosphorylase